MRKAFLFFSKTLLLFSFLLLIQINAEAQNVIEFFTSSYAHSKSLKDVHFHFVQGSKTLKDETTKTGENSFVVMQGKGRYVLKADKEGYATKYFYFNSENYPYEYEYELQDVALAFVELDKSELDYQMGEVMWNHQDAEFQVVEIDSSMLPENKSLASEMNKMDQTYDLAIKNGDEKFQEEQYRHAVSYYEVALFARPRDPYATEMLAKCNAKSEPIASPGVVPTAAASNTGSKTSEEGSSTSAPMSAPTINLDAAMLDKINRGELTEVDAGHIDQSVIYSVQLGAFALGTDASKFPGVPELKIIPYDDFTRCFTGEFNDVNKAIERRSQMRDGKYKDAFIVKMKDNKKIGF